MRVDACGVAGRSGGDQATLARAVAYAADPRLEVAGADVAAGADVIVSSLRPSSAANWALTTVLENAILFATRQGRRGRGTPIFWASSNGNVDIGLDQVVSHPNVIAVGRSHRNESRGQLRLWAQLAFLAPGVNVVSTASGAVRAQTPERASLPPLRLARRPRSEHQSLPHSRRCAPDYVRHLRQDRRCQLQPAGHNDDYGFGRVSAFRAVVRAMFFIAVNGVLYTDRMPIA